MNFNIEAVVIREVYEETSIKATPIGIIGIRHMLQTLNENDVSNELLTIWELKYEEGNPKPDRREIIEVAFFQIDELLNSPEIGGWTKEIVSSSLSGNGLKNSTYSPKTHPNGTIYWKSYLG